MFGTQGGIRQAITRNPEGNPSIAPEVQFALFMESSGQLSPEDRRALELWLQKRKLEKAQSAGGSSAPPPPMPPGIGLGPRPPMPPGLNHRGGPAPPPSFWGPSRMGMPRPSELLQPSASFAPHNLTGFKGPPPPDRPAAPVRRIGLGPASAPPPPPSDPRPATLADPDLEMFKFVEMLEEAKEEKEKQRQQETRPPSDDGRAPWRHRAHEDLPSQGYGGDMPRGMPQDRPHPIEQGYRRGYGDLDRGRPGGYDEPPRGREWEHERERDRERGRDRDWDRDRERGGRAGMERSRDRDRGRGGERSRERGAGNRDRVREDNLYFGERDKELTGGEQGRRSPPRESGTERTRRLAQERESERQRKLRELEKKKKEKASRSKAKPKERVYRRKVRSRSRSRSRRKDNRRRYSKSRSRSRSKSPSPPPSKASSGSTKARKRPSRFSDPPKVPLVVTTMETTKTLPMAEKKEEPAPAPVEEKKPVGVIRGAKRKEAMKEAMRKQLAEKKARAKAEAEAIVAQRLRPKGQAANTRTDGVAIHGGKSFAHQLIAEKLRAGQAEYTGPGNLAKPPLAQPSQPELQPEPKATEEEDVDGVPLAEEEEEVDFEEDVDGEPLADEDGPSAGSATAEEWNVGWHETSETSPQEQEKPPTKDPEEPEDTAAKGDEVAEAVSPQEEDDDQGVRLYVHPVPDEVENDDLIKLFQRYGQVTQLIRMPDFFFIDLEETEGGHKACGALNRTQVFRPFLPASHPHSKNKVEVFEASDEFYERKMQEEEESEGREEEKVVEEEPSKKQPAAQSPKAKSGTRTAGKAEASKKTAGKSAPKKTKKTSPKPTPKPTNNKKSTKPKPTKQSDSKKPTTESKKKHTSAKTPKDKSDPKNSEQSSTKKEEATKSKNTPQQKSTSSEKKGSQSTNKRVRETGPTKQPLSKRQARGTGKKPTDTYHPNEPRNTRPNLNSSNRFERRDMGPLEPRDRLPPSRFDGPPPMHGRGPPPFDDRGPGGPPRFHEPMMGRPFDNARPPSPRMMGGPPSPRMMGRPPSPRMMGGGPEFPLDQPGFREGGFSPRMHPELGFDRMPPRLELERDMLPPHEIDHLDRRQPLPSAGSRRVEIKAKNPPRSRPQAAVRVSSGSRPTPVVRGGRGTVRVGRGGLSRGPIRAPPGRMAVKKPVLAKRPVLRGRGKGPAKVMVSGKAAHPKGKQRKGPLGSDAPDDTSFEIKSFDEIMKAKKK